MHNDNLQQLQQYITENLAHGYSKEHISRMLIKSGWPQDYIDRAFMTEAAMPLPPVPTPSRSSTDWRTALQSPLVVELLLSFGLGFINMVAFLLLIPSKAQQIVDYIRNLYSGWTFSPVIIRVLIITLVIGVISSSILYLRFKGKSVSFSLIIVSLMAVFLSLIAEQNRLVGHTFSICLLITFPIAQIFWHYARRLVVLRIMYGIVTLILFVLSVRVLNTGSL